MKLLGDDCFNWINRPTQSHCPRIADDSPTDVRTETEDFIYGKAFLAAANMKRVFKMNGEYFEVTFPYLGTTGSPLAGFPVNTSREGNSGHISDILGRFRYFKARLGKNEITFAAPQDYFLCSRGGEAHGVVYDGPSSNPNYKLSSTFHQDFIKKSFTKIGSLPVRKLSVREKNLIRADDNLNSFDLASCDNLALVRKKEMCLAKLESAKVMVESCTKLTRKLPELRTGVEGLQNSIADFESRLRGIANGAPTPDALSEGLVKGPAPAAK